MPAITYNSQFETKLRERVQVAREGLIEEIAGGHACKTLDAYRERVGYLNALRDLDGWCREVETELQER